MTTVSLSRSQKRKAVETARYIRDNPDAKPSQFVDNWNPKPYVTSYEAVNEEEREVDVSMIVGVASQNIERLVAKRLIKILKKLHDEEFERVPSREPKMLPHLEKIDGKYYVSSDGIHRVLAHKILEIETIYAEVTCYEKPYVKS